MNDNRNPRCTSSSSNSSSSSSFHHIPKPQQSLFPLFIHIRDQWNQRKQLQQQQQEAEAAQNSASAGQSKNGGVDLLAKPCEGKDGYFR